jgi:hypothetical protein
MTSLYAATELGSDLQSLGFLGHHAVDRARLAAFRKAVGIDIPRVARWMIRKSTQHGIGNAELTGWILAGQNPPEPAGLPTLLHGDKVGVDALPSAAFGGLIRMGQTPNGEYWAADLTKKSVPVLLFDPSPEHIRHGWRRRFDRLDDFLFFAAKAALCQRDRINVDEFIEFADERGVRPEELVPDALEDDRGALGRRGLRRPRKIPATANRFLWLDVLTTDLLSRPATPDEVARLWVNVLKLHTIREDRDDLTCPTVQAFWLLRHSLLGDQTGYVRVLAKVDAAPTGLTTRADALARRFWQKKKAPFDRDAVAKAIEARVAR